MRLKDFIPAAYREQFATYFDPLVLEPPASEVAAHNN